MRKIEFVLFQLDEARRYIEDGRLAQLRLSLLLLDNAAEIQMDRCIRNELWYEDMKERIRSKISQIPKQPRSKELQDIISWSPLSKKEKRQIERYFDEKVRFLTERFGKLDLRIAGPLKYLHKYRNEAYHRSKVRRETIDTAAKILLDINCEILLSLIPGRSWSSDEDYSWLEERFGKPAARALGDKEFLRNAVNDIRSKISIDDQSIATILAEHLESRINGVFDALDFLVENSRDHNRETALRDSEYYGETRRGIIETQSFPVDYFIGKYSLALIDRLKKQITEITKASDKFQAFHLFSILEVELEPLEDDVQQFAAEVDNMIQMQINELHGK